MPLADAHLHLFANGFAGTLAPPLHGADDLVAYEHLRRRHGIERALVIGYEGEPRYAGNNAHVLGLARTRPWLTPLAYIPVSPPPRIEQVRMLLEDGAAGFAIYLLLEDDGRALGGWPAALLAELRERRVIVSLNVRPAAAAAIQDVVDALEGCPILVSHLGLPGRFARAPAPGQAREVLAPLLALASRAHVAAKLSGLYAISDPAHDFPHAAAQPFADLLLDTFGPARLLWGSDFAPALEFVSFAQTVDLRVLVRCSPAEIDDVMGGNLLRLLDRREQ